MSIQEQAAASESGSSGEILAESFADPSAKARTGLAQRAVLLAQVQADAQLHGQFQVIVDDQLGIVALAQLAQGAGFIEAARLVAGFLAVLQQARAALQRGFHVGQQASLGEQGTVGDGVQAATIHHEASSGRRRGMYWPWPGASASRRQRQV